MTLFVVGTGRCGTYSIATAFKDMGYDAHHERWSTTTVQSSHWYATGRMTHEEATLLLTATDWGQVEVDANLSHLVPVLTDLPDTKFLWVKRDPFKVEKSMTRMGWYRTEDDYIPSIYHSGFKRFGDQVLLYAILNHAGHRVKAYEVTDIPADKWRDAQPFVRCRWFIDWLTQYLDHYLPEDRTRIIDIDTVTAVDLMDIANWAFPTQPPNRLDEVPNRRVEDPQYVSMAQPAPRKDTV